MNRTPETSHARGGSQFRGDPLAGKLLEPFGIATYGLELGNWTGFHGLLLSSGIASFAEVEILANDDPDQHFGFRARVLQRGLDLAVDYRSERIGDAGIQTKVIVEARRDSWLGDVAIHASFRDASGLGRLDGRPLSEPGLYVRAADPLRPRLALANRPFEVESRLSDDMPCDQELVPYAVRLGDGRVRFHTRCQCFGGPRSRLVLRGRSALGAWMPGLACPAWARPWLYRKELRRPRLFPNFQLCAVTRLSAGQRFEIAQCLTPGV